MKPGEEHFIFDAPDFDTADLSFDFEAVDNGPKPAKKKPTAAEAIGLGSQTRIVTRRKGAQYLNALGVKNAAALIQELPKAGEVLHALMGGEFHAWDLIPAMQQLMGEAIAELYITTLGFNHSNNQALCDMIDAGTVQTAKILCSAYFQGADRDVFNAAKERLESRGQVLAAVRNHSKIILIKPAKSKSRFVVESSANLRSCNNVEQLSLFNCPDLFEFHKGWIEKAIANA